MSRQTKSTLTYKSPFSKAYWRDAAMELKDTKMLVFAALMIALRLVLKTFVVIPLAPNLNINTAFLANALGAMTFGPVMAGICAVITDVLGFLLKPVGVYFVPFVLTEVAGSVIFALFLYRAKVTPARVMLSRFCICFFVNVLLQAPIMMWYNAVTVGSSSYVLTIPGIVKNLFMFPIESVVLTLFLRVMLPITNRLGLTYGGNAKDNLRFSNKQVALLVVLLVVGAASVFGYLNYHYQTTSLSAAYSTQERIAANQSMQEILLEEGSVSGEPVTIVESAMKPFLGSEITYTVGVYEVTGEYSEEMWKLSKSKAAKDENLTRVGTAEIVVNSKTGETLSYSYTPQPPEE
ncbi:MAG TPA: folate family ECF transporter S component [Candidatus Faecousia intestinigallinarum]|nr:folate family ECF transporter S component [Candidatus Faecousia intestinigallinarum]